MKNQIIYTFFLVFLSNIGIAQFSSNISTLNPAMTGFLDKKFGHIQYSNFTVKDDNIHNGVSGLYNHSFDRINSGVGINFNQSQYTYSNFTNIGGSYQYTFKFSEEFKLAVGASLNYLTQKNKGTQITNDNFSSREYLLLNFGTAIKWKGLNAGVSLSNFDLLSNSSSENPSSIEQRHPYSFNPINIHVWYDFQIGDNFVLSPNIITGDLSFLNLRGEHYNRFWWNVGYGQGGTYYGGVGVRVFDNFNLGYNVGFHERTETFFHRISLTYKLGK